MYISTLLPHRRQMIPVSDGRETARHAKVGGARTGREASRGQAIGKAGGSRDHQPESVNQDCLVTRAVGPITPRLLTPGARSPEAMCALATICATLAGAAAYARPEEAAAFGAAVGSGSGSFGEKTSAALGDAFVFVLTNGPIIALFGLLFNSNGRTRESLGKLTEAVDTLKTNGREIKDTLKSIEKSQRLLEAGQKTLEAGQKTLESSQETLKIGQRGLRTDQKYLRNSQRGIRRDVRKVFTRVDHLEDTNRPWWRPR